MGRKGLHLAVRVGHVTIKEDGTSVALYGDRENTVGVAAYCANCQGQTIELCLPVGTEAAVRPGDALVLSGGPGGDGCIAKADVNEPLFVMRAQDETADIATRVWVLLQLRAHGVAIALDVALDDTGNAISDAISAAHEDLGPELAGKLHEALALAAEMAAWPVRKLAD